VPQASRKAGLSGLFCCLALTVAGNAAGETIAIDVASAAVAYDQRSGQPVVSFRMTEDSKRRFGEFTARHVGRKADFRLDGRVVMSAVIREPITGGTGQIASQFSAAEAAEIAERLAAGTARVEIEAAD
jgi:preprotein translocase subunit SecD